MKVLVTGPGGFVGSHLVNSLISKNYSIVRCGRNEIGDISAFNDWDTILEGVDFVIHLAARVHVMNDQAKDPLAEFRKVNVVPTENLVNACIKKNIKHFVFLSSIKVNGEGSKIPYNELSETLPVDPYGVSKLEAESLIVDILSNTNIKHTIIRTPLIYGDGVKGNYRLITRLVKTRMPLPFGGLSAKRSFLSVDKLVNYIISTIQKQDELYKLKVLSDSKPLTVSDLVRKIGKENNIRTTVFWLPAFFIRFFLTIIGRKEIYSRLNSPLVCNSIYED